MKENVPIPCLDLKRQYFQIKEEVLEKIETVLDDISFSGGKYIEEFENEFASYCGALQCVAVNNGSSALHLAMLALGIGKGDEVIVPANTFIATAWAVNYTGAVPIFVDCKDSTWEIDANKIEEKISSKTKAVIGVHLYGQAFDVDEVLKITKTHNLFLIEDAAQAHGASYKGKMAGTLGDISCFSFYPGKNLGTYGEGGAIITDNPLYVSHIKSLRNYGSSIRYYHDEVGFNMRMGGMEAAVLSIKLKYLNDWNGKRREIAKKYQLGIVNPKIRLQFQPEFTISNYHLFVITTEDRDRLMEYLNIRNIFPGLHYPVPCHLQKAYSHLNYKKGDFPNAEYLSNHCLSLPMFAELHNDEIGKIIKALNEY